MCFDQRVKGENQENGGWQSFFNKIVHEIQKNQELTNYENAEH